MLDVWFFSLISIALTAAVITSGFAIAKRPPHVVGLGALAVVELSLIAQLVASIVFALTPGHNPQNLPEFFIYLVVAMLVPALAILWSLVERVFWSNYVLAVGAFTVFVMAARMHILWPAG
ncbi:MAG: hypothetical protein RL196_1325 [Actinomycetota bacterium]|jgi:hypothetical protein